MAIRREGRGQLSSIDLLPDEAQDDIVWACRELDARQRTQSDILFELNDKLEAKGLSGLSKSAFNRWSTKRWAAVRRVAEARQIFAGLADQFTPEAVDEGNVILGEFLKMLVFELAQRETAEHTPKGAMELARAYLASVQAQRLSTDRRKKLEADFAAKTEAAIDRVAAEAGLSAERVAQVRRDVLGVRPALAPAADAAPKAAP